MDDLDKAGDLVLAALALETGDRRNDAECLCTLGTIHHRRGEYSTALDYHEQALRLARDAETPFPDARALIGLALAYQYLGQWDEAIAQARKALTLTRKIGYRVFEGRALTALAGIHLARGDRDAAVTAARQALVVHRATGHRLGEGTRRRCSMPPKSLRPPVNRCRTSGPGKGARTGRSPRPRC